MNGSNREWEVGTDIGGTFTDIIAIRRDPAETRIAKVPSRPHAPVDAMLEAIEAVGLQKDQVKRFVHGTTRVTNAIVEERLPKVALVATAGFEDVLDIGRYRRRDLYRLDIPPKSPSLVPRELCFGLVERLDHEGNVLKPLQDREIDRLVTWLKQTGVQSVAVALLHAYANPVHERMLAERLKAIVPHVSLSHEVNPEAREYERTSSTVFNAAATPIAVEYLSELEQRLPIGPGLQVFHSAEAMVPIAAVKRRPLVMAMSGPAAGVSASVSIARQLGTPRMLTFDMGGTTTDVCLIIDGQAEMADGRMLGIGRCVSRCWRCTRSVREVVRSCAMGRAARPWDPRARDRNPARPAMAAAARRRRSPMPTRCSGISIPNAARGPYQPRHRGRPGRRCAHCTGAETEPAETALGIVKVANATMARALRRVTVERGIDGRDCTLLAFGGGGPMHAAGMADLYGIGSIVVPNASSAFSALGCLTADFSFLQQQTFRVALDDIDLGRVLKRIETLIEQASEPLIANGVARAAIDVELVALMRYAAQNDAIAVPFSLPLDATRLREDIFFHTTNCSATRRRRVASSNWCACRRGGHRPPSSIAPRPLSENCVRPHADAHLMVAMTWRPRSWTALPWRKRSPGLRSLKTRGPRL